MEVICVSCQKISFQLLRHILQCIRLQTCRRNGVANIPEVRLIIFAVTLVKLVYFCKGMCICNLNDGQSDFLKCF